MSLTPGTRIGSYEILASIGAGGMGEVYRAKDTTLNRDVAIKVLPDLFATDPERLARFTREAQSLAALNHSNIAAIYGVEQSGQGVRALVMELVEGEDLSVHIARGPVPVDDAVRIARQIADALGAAHDAGIIHRDLKPANVKVRHDGTVKVLDFGLAKAMDPAGASNPELMNSPTMTARATAMGMIIGTAAYMAPEQAKGRAVDKRADIWAFGVVLFEMLAGRRAFTGEDVSDVLAAVLRQEIDWSALPAATPVRVRRVLERCLERDPKLRLRDIGDAWIGMDAAEPAPVAAAAPVPRSALSRWLPWAAGLVIAAGAITWHFLSAPDPEPLIVTRSSQSIKELALFADVSRDGSRIAYSIASQQAGSAGLVLRMVDQFEGKLVPGTEGAVFALLAPDGMWLAYTDGQANKIKKIPVTGGTSVTLSDGTFQSGAAWGLDNTIVFSGAKGLMRVSADGGTPEALTTVDSAKGETAHTRPQFLPGERQLLFTVTSQAGPQFAVRDLSTTGHRVVAKGGVNGKYVASGLAAGVGHLTYVRGTTIFALPFDVSRLAVVGGEVPVVEAVSLTGPPDTGDYAVSTDGLLAYFTNGQTVAGTTLAWADRAGATKVLPGKSRSDWATGRLSPDGTRVANGISTEGSQSDIWVLDVERGSPKRLTFGGANDYPLFAPDNRTVFYTGEVGGKFGLYSVPADASAKPTLVLATETSARPSSFTPDGKTLVYSQEGPDKSLRIHLLALLAGGGESGKSGGKFLEPRPWHESAGTEFEAAVSPDGRWVAYTSTETGTAEVFVQAFSGTGAKTLVSTNGGQGPRWSRDGRELFYRTSLGLLAVAVTATPAFHAGEPRKLFELIAGTTWDTTPDKNRFLVELISAGGGSTLAVVTNWFEELRRRAPAKK